MKFSKNITIWFLLSICALMVLLAMGWITRGAIIADKERELAEFRANLEEYTRLALWRMDSAGAAIVSAENSHPFSVYENEMSDYFTEDNSMVKLHFSLRENGMVKSSDANADVEALGELKEKLSKISDTNDQWLFLKKTIEVKENAWGSAPGLREAKVKSEDLSFSNIRLEQKDELDNELKRQRALNARDQSNRVKSVKEVVSNSYNGLEKSNGKLIPQPKKSGKVSKSKAIAKLSKRAEVDSEVTVEIADLFSDDVSLWENEGSIAKQDLVDRSQLLELGAMNAVWVGSDLFLLRKYTELVDGAEEEGVQGVWMNTDSLKQYLLNEVLELFPNAQLIDTKNTSNESLALVSFPFKFIHNESPIGISGSMPKSLIVGWVAVLIALVTVGSLVFGIMRLSERRASFVSSVTHELRTPLTTFRLYADMLEKGAVKEEKRGKYLKVLTREADRLSHLVENVLSFSQIERGSARSVVSSMTVLELVDSMRERLAERLATAELSLHVDLADETELKVDSAVVEHILFNLIDNAAKYAADSDPAQVDLKVRKEGAQLCIYIQDYGKGIQSSERNRIFRAFHKSAREAAESKPGVGLGLALSRRLAGSLGGELVNRPSDQGACFILKLPV